FAHRRRPPRSTRFPYTTLFRSVGRERRRPDDARVVVVLLDRGGDGAGDADPVAAHLDRPLRAPGVEEGGAHGLAVLRAEQEDLPHLDAAVLGEGAALAARAAVAAARLPQVGEGEVRHVALEVEVDDVLVGAVGPAHGAA